MIFVNVFGISNMKLIPEKSYIRKQKKVKDIRGQRFGLLVALRLVGEDRHYRKIWLCRCDCGVEKDIPSRYLTVAGVVSCGCRQKEISADNGKIGAWKISGSRSYLYNHRLTDEERFKRRNQVEAREWRKAVFKRDDWTCDLCGKRGKKIQAHHLYSWADYPLKRFDIANGITLCKRHHWMFHLWNGGPRMPCRVRDYRKFKAAWYINNEIKKRENDVNASGNSGTTNTEVPRS